MVILIFAVISAAFLVSSSFVFVELCPYISTESGINQTHYVINTFLADASQHVNPNTDDRVKILPSKNLLYGIEFACEPSQENANPHLLPKIGIDHFIDLKPFVTPENIEQMITEVST